jgi:hypothetical protein
MVYPSTEIASFPTSVVASWMPKGYLEEPLVVTGPHDVAAVALRGAQQRSYRNPSFPFPDRKHYSYQDPVPKYVYKDTIDVQTPWPRRD